MLQLTWIKIDYILSGTRVLSEFLIRTPPPHIPYLSTSTSQCMTTNNYKICEEFRYESNDLHVRVRNIKWRTSIRMNMLYIHTRMIFYSDKRQFIFFSIQMVLNMYRIPVIINERKSHNKSIIYHSLYNFYNPRACLLIMIYLLNSET